MTPASGRAMVAQDITRIVWVSDPQISPDGVRVAFVATVASATPPLRVKAALRPSGDHTVMPALLLSSASLMSLDSNHVPSFCNSM